MKPSLFAAVALAALVTAQTCTTNSCATYCQAYDSILSNCGANNGGFDSDVSCFCEAGYGLSKDTGILNLCVACNQNGLGAADLSIYQIGTVVCDYYLSDGEAAAASVASKQVSDVIATYSATFLPIIQSGLCTAGVPTAALASSAYHSYSTVTAVASQIGGLAGTNAGSSVSLPARTSVAVAGTLVPGLLSSGQGTTTTSAGGQTTTPSGTPTGQSASAQMTVPAHAGAPRNLQAANLALMAIPLVGALV